VCHTVCLVRNIRNPVIQRQAVPLAEGFDAKVWRLQVCVESLSSSLSMTLPTFAAEHRRLQQGGAPVPIDRYLLPTELSAANPYTATAAVDR